MEDNKSRGAARFFPSERNRGRPTEQLEVMRMGVIRVEKLAIHGGTPVRTKPWVSKYMGSEELGAEEKARVLKVLEKKRIFRYLPDGLETSEASALEEEYKSFLGTKYALAVNSGTSALICALVAAGVGPG